MNEIDRIKDQLERALNGPAWSGPSLLQVLEGVDAQKAAKRPLTNVHTIWELVLHTIKWEEIALGRLKGIDIRPTPDEDWRKPADINEKAWQNTLEMLKKVHTDLLDEISKLKTDKLDEPSLPKESFLSVYILLQGVAQHNLYHAGQIAILKKI
jgi:uncharacterized damage-inducible protein DinB